jgi:hypothetical protein
LAPARGLIAVASSDGLDSSIADAFFDFDEDGSKWQRSSQHLSIARTLCADARPVARRGVALGCGPDA